MFLSNKNHRRYYLGIQESKPHQTMSSKSYCTKVMFVAADVCPRWNTTTNRQFDGEIIIWTFVIIETI